MEEGRRGVRRISAGRPWFAAAVDRRVHASWHPPNVRRRSGCGMGRFSHRVYEELAPQIHGFEHRRFQVWTLLRLSVRRFVELEATRD